MFVNFNIFLISLILSLFAGEMSLRIHHYWKYGVSEPIYNYLITYSAKAVGIKKMAQNQPHLSRKSQMIWSGGSVAFGYNLAIKPVDLLSFESTLRFTDITRPGQRFGQEIDLINQLDLPAVSLTGFNDFSFFYSRVLNLQNTKRKILDRRFIRALNSSLLFHHILDTIYFYFLDENQILNEQLGLLRSKLEKLDLKHRVFVFIQPVMASYFNEGNTSHRSVYPENWKLFHSRRREFLEILTQHEMLQLVDLQGAVEGLEDHHFTDICHLNTEGTILVIRSIWQRLEEMIRN